jgi:AcrR family transcriptional regulator
MIGFSAVFNPVDLQMLCPQSLFQSLFVDGEQAGVTDWPLALEMQAQKRCCKNFGNSQGQDLTQNRPVCIVWCMSETRTKKSDARQRIVETAGQSFYAEGVRAVGIDWIIAEAGVAKMTLYNHSPPKVDLVLAVVEFREAKFDVMFEKWMGRHAKAGMDRLDAFLAALKDWFISPGFRGCMFINTCAELADAEHPASKFSADHKQRFHAMLKEIIAEAKGDKVAESVSPAIALLVEGAIVSAVIQQSVESAETARAAAVGLIAKQPKR